MDLVQKLSPKLTALGTISTAFSHLSFFGLALVLVISGCAPENVTDQISTLRFLVKQKGKYGYIDETGKIVIQPQFEWGKDFSDGLAPVVVDKKCGYIDISGTVVIPPKFVGGRRFSDGLAAVNCDGRGSYGSSLGVDGGKWGFIDRSGYVIIKPQFESTLFADEDDFSSGLARIRITSPRKYGFIDKSGGIAIEPKFDRAFRFSEGLAAVAIDSKFGYIDTSGEFAIPPQFDMAFYFSEGLADIRVGKKWGYVDKSGTIVIEPQFIEANRFSEGLASVKTKTDWVCINRSGKEVARHQYSGRDSRFSEGLAPTGKWGFTVPIWGFMDKTGTIVVEPKFNQVGPFTNGLARVRVGDSDIGYINKQGKYVWEPRN